MRKPPQKTQGCNHDKGKTAGPVCKGWHNLIILKAIGLTLPVIIYYNNGKDCDLSKE